MLRSKHQLLTTWIWLCPLAMPLAVNAPAFADASIAPEISIDELKTLVDKKGAVILDANGDSVFKEGHIPGAIHYGSQQKNLAKVLPADKNALIVAYCGGPMCTAWEDAAKDAKKLGYTNIKHFKGGIKTWKSTGQKTEKS